MTTFWRRQTQSGGNYPSIPATAPGVPFWPQTLPPGTVVGRLSANSGPTEAIPFSYLTALLSASLTIQTITASGSQAIDATAQVVVINKTIASATPLTLPTVFGRDKVQLEIYDWTGLAGDMTLTPFGTEKIMGLSSWIVGSGGVTGSGGSLKLLPLTDLTGWLVR